VNNQPRQGGCVGLLVVLMMLAVISVALVYAHLQVPSTATQSSPAVASSPSVSQPGRPLLWLLSNRRMAGELQLVAWLSVLLVGVIAAVRAAATVVTLRGRETHIALASDGFEAHEHAVDRFSRGLTHLHAVVRGWLDSPAQAVTVRFRSMGEGRVAYLLECPRGARSALQAAVGHYAEVELRPLEQFVLPGQSRVVEQESPPSQTPVVVEPIDGIPETRIPRLPW
jgi:hypothetical protein